jgi:hypothetical protein
MASSAGPTDGNWPSFVYVTVRKGKALSRVLSQALRHGGAFVPLSEQQLHISLSKTFYLRAHHIEPFLQELALSIGLVSRCVRVCALLPLTVLASLSLSHSLPAFAPLARRFQVRAGGGEPIVLANETQSSEYLCVRVADISGGLQHLVKAVDEIMVRFRQPTYFDEPIFHISVAENRIVPPGDAQEAEVVVSQGQEGDEEEDEEEDEDEEEETGDAEEASPVCVLPVYTIGCSIGNRHFRLDLKAKVGRQTKMSRLDFREVIIKTSKG